MVKEKRAKTRRRAENSLGAQIPGKREQRKGALVPQEKEFNSKEESKAEVDHF